MNAIHRRSTPRSCVLGRLLRVLLVLGLAVPACWPPPVHAVPPPPLTVSSTENSGPDTLREAIGAATDGYTIVFGEALAGETITLLSPLLLDKDLTIDGSALAAPVTLSGGGAVRILEVAEGATVWVLGLVFEEGQASENADDEPANRGGAILNAGTLTLTDCTLTGNRGYRGAAIYNAAAGVLTVSDCTISGNHAANSGGGIGSEGLLTLQGSVISTNSAPGAIGGGLISESLLGATVTACTFGANTSLAGGAIGAGGPLTVADTTLVGNTAGLGGAIFSMATLTMTNSTLTANIATGHSVVPTIGGGGLLNMHEATVRHTTFAGNRAPAGLGGGIMNVATLDYANTIVAGSTGGDCVQVSGGDPGEPLTYEITGNVHNLVEDGSCEAEFSGDPLLGPLAANGGPTQTMALLSGSPAINAGDADASLLTDQRGVARPQAVAPDIGAYELQTPIAATTDVADAITTMGATLHATVTAGDRAEVVFEVGTTTAYGTTVAPIPGVLTGTAPSTLSATVDGLDVNTTYHYRVVAANEVGVAHGEDRTFTTAIMAPEAVTEEASDVLATGATLRATVNAVGVETAVTFEYGPTTAYGATVAAAPSPLTGREDTAVSAVLTGLETHQVYHYRVVAVSDGGETRGEDRTFTPGQNAPAAVTGAATTVGGTGAVLRGTVNAHGYPATVRFSYGPTAAYGATVAADPQAVTGTGAVAVVCILDGLVPHRIYHYRVEAESVAGRTDGEDGTFAIGGAHYDVAVPLLLR